MQFLFIRADVTAITDKGHEAKIMNFLLHVIYNIYALGYEFPVTDIAYL